MTRVLTNCSAALAAVLIFSCALHAQYGAGTAVGGQRAKTTTNDAAAAPPAPAPAPARDIQGLWMRRTPKGVFGSGATYTKDLPEMTAWGQAKFKEAKDSNGGAYTLDQTNDPVLTRCYPPGVPRVYFHPYPFEFVQTPEYMLMVLNMTTLRSLYARPLPRPDPLAQVFGRSLEGGTTFVVDTVGFNEKTWLDRRCSVARCVSSGSTASMRSWASHDARSQSLGQALGQQTLLRAKERLGTGGD
jgi:hypothetical protein